MNFKISLLCSVALAVVPSVSDAVEVIVSGSYTNAYVGSGNAGDPDYGDLTVTTQNAEFNNDFIGTKNNNVVNQVINFNGKRAKKDVVGLFRDRNGGNICAWEIPISLEAQILANQGER